MRRIAGVREPMMVGHTLFADRTHRVVLVVAMLLTPCGFLAGRAVSSQNPCPSLRPFPVTFYYKKSAGQQAYPPPLQEFYPSQYVPGFQYIAGEYYSVNSRGGHLSFEQMRQRIARFYQQHVVDASLRSRAK